MFICINMFHLIDIFTKCKWVFFSFSLSWESSNACRKQFIFLHPLNISFEQSLNDFLLFHNLSVVRLELFFSQYFIVYHFCIFVSFFYEVSFIRSLEMINPLVTYLSNPGITSVMPWAVGCLTKENTQECRAFFTQCRALFVDFFHF